MLMRLALVLVDRPPFVRRKQRYAIYDGNTEKTGAKLMYQGVRESTRYWYSE